MTMRALGVGVLLLAAVPPLLAEGAGSAALEVGKRIRTRIAEEYRTDDIDVSEHRLSARGASVEQDHRTITVTSSEGNTVRYPARGASLVGRLDGIEPDWLTLSLDDGRPPVRVPRCAILAIDVSRNGFDRKARGAKRGALFLGIPLGLGIIVANGLGSIDCESSCDAMNPLVGMGIGLAAGAVVGAYVSDGERWEKVDIAMGPRRGGGVAAALSLRF